MPDNGMSVEDQAPHSSDVLAGHLAPHFAAGPGDVPLVSPEEAVC